MSYNPQNANGQATMANSSPVVISSDQSAVSTKVDQTTPGTTDAVTIKASTGAGTSVVIKDDTAFGDGITTGIAAISGRLYNGTNYDRARGSAASGAWVQAKGATAGGLTTHTLISAATTNATSVKASAGQIYAIQASNTGAAVAFLKIYNKATAPTVGTDTAVKTLILPAGGGTNVSFADIGAALGTGIAYAITGLATTADATAVALAQVVVNIDYV